MFRYRVAANKLQGRAKEVELDLAQHGTIDNCIPLQCPSWQTFLEHHQTVPAFCVQTPFWRCSSSSASLAFLHRSCHQTALAATALKHQSLRPTAHDDCDTILAYMCTKMSLKPEARNCSTIHSCSIFWLECRSQSSRILTLCQPTAPSQITKTS